ncbi:MAG: hypothetical protein R3F55_15585 [Alphaproteobacteria bacterium]
MEQQWDNLPERFVSPFLQRPLRDLAQALRDIAAARAERTLPVHDRDDRG